MKSYALIAAALAMAATSMSGAAQARSLQGASNCNGIHCQCWIAYDGNRRALKALAKADCIRAGSSGWNIVRNETYRKLSCDKHRANGNTTVTVRGKLTFVCN